VVNKKLYLSVYINNFRSTALLDSGSDVSIIQHSLFKKIAKNTTYVPLENMNLTSFSNTPITVLGQYETTIYFNKQQGGLKLTFLIIKDINNSPPPAFG
jgi:hypothetical protein